MRVGRSEKAEELQPLFPGRVFGHFGAERADFRRLHRLPACRGRANHHGHRHGARAAEHAARVRQHHLARHCGRRQCLSERRGPREAEQPRL